MKIRRLTDAERRDLPAPFAGREFSAVWVEESDDAAFEPGDRVVFRPAAPTDRPEPDALWLAVSDRAEGRVGHIQTSEANIPLLIAGLDPRQESLALDGDWRAVGPVVFVLRRYGK